MSGLDMHHDREGRRRRALGILTAETTVVDKPAEEVRRGLLRVVANQALLGRTARV